jgi:hypothetical protein
VGDYAHVIDAEVIEKSYGVVAEATASFGVHVVALTEGTVVEGDAGVVLGEVGHLPPPAEVVAALAMGEEDCRAGAVHLVVEVDAVDGRERHAGILGQRTWKQAKREWKGRLRDMGRRLGSADTAGLFLRLFFPVLFGAWK